MLARNQFLQSSLAENVATLFWLPSRFDPGLEPRIIHVNSALRRDQSFAALPLVNALFDQWLHHNDGANPECTMQYCFKSNLQKSGPSPDRRLSFWHHTADCVDN